MSERYLAWVYQDERDPCPALVRVEPTDRLCDTHHVILRDPTPGVLVTCHFGKQGTACKMVDVVRMEYPDTGLEENDGDGE